MRITEVRHGVHVVEGRDVSWVVLVEGDAFTLVDAGYPGYHADVLESFRRIGVRREALAAVLITHAHVDHVGGVPALVDGTDVPVLAGAAELPQAHGDAVESATPLDVVRNIHRHGFLPWGLRITRAGATRHAVVPRATTWTGDGPLDVPGRPVPVATPGHTSGHSVFHLPDVGVVITGDTLVTGHATSRVTGPQLLPPVFDHDRSGVVASLDVLAGLDADLVAPGHGPVHEGPIADAVARAKGSRPRRD